MNRDTLETVALAGAATVAGAAAGWVAGKAGADAVRRVLHELDEPGLPTGHAAPDLAASGDPGAGGRAPEAFRPDPTAVPTDAEREALRPAGLSGA